MSARPPPPEVGLPVRLPPDEPVRVRPVGRLNQVAAEGFCERRHERHVAGLAGLRPNETEASVELLVLETIRDPEATVGAGSGTLLAAAPGVVGAAAAVLEGHLGQGPLNSDGRLL